MNLFVLFSAINVLIVGTISSYTDIKYGKIFNKSIGAGFISGLLILVSFYGRYFDSTYLKNAAVNGSIGIIFGYLLWFFKKWSAGDAKLFSFFSFFLPLSFYQNSYIDFFPSISILISAFIIIVIYTFLNSLIFMTHKLFTKGFVFKLNSINRHNAFNLSKVVLSYVFIVYLVSRLSQMRFISAVVFNNLAVFFVIYFLYGPVAGNKKISNILSVFSLCILFYLVASGNPGVYPILYKAIIYVVAIGTIRYCFDFYIKNKETVGVKVKDLKRGKVLVESEINKITSSIDKKEGKFDFNEVRSYGLNASQIEIIKNLYNEDDILTVYKTFYLGPLMLGAVIITMITGNSLMSMIIEALSIF